MNRIFHDAICPDFLKVGTLDWTSLEENGSPPFTRLTIFFSGQYEGKIIRQLKEWDEHEFQYITLDGIFSSVFH